MQISRQCGEKTKGITTYPVNYKVNGVFWQRRFLRSQAVGRKNVHKEETGLFLDQEGCGGRRTQRWEKKAAMEKR